jgi:hypothetical protein
MKPYLVHSLLLRLAIISSATAASISFPDALEKETSDTERILRGATNQLIGPKQLAPQTISTFTPNQASPDYPDLIGPLQLINPLEEFEESVTSTSEAPLAGIPSPQTIISVTVGSIILGFGAIMAFRRKSDQTRLVE